MLGSAEPDKAYFLDMHGHTVLLAIALTSKEGTADYEWQWDCYKDFVGVDPDIISTDGDPSVTAAIASQFPRTKTACGVGGIDIKTCARTCLACSGQNNTVTS